MGKLIDPERLKSRLESYAETYKSAGMDVPYDMAVVTDIIDRSINSYDVDYVAEDVADMLGGIVDENLLDDVVSCIKRGYSLNTYT